MYKYKYKYKSVYYSNVGIYTTKKHIKTHIYVQDTQQNMRLEM